MSRSWHLELPKVLANEQIEARVLQLEVEKNVDDFNSASAREGNACLLLYRPCFHVGKKE